MTPRGAGSGNGEKTEGALALCAAPTPPPPWRPRGQQGALQPDIGVFGVSGTLLLA